MTANSQYAVQVGLPRVAVSMASAALFYLCWMAVFIVLPTEVSPLLRGFLWVAAPIVTALGFLTGAALFSHFRHSPRLTLGRLYLYPLVGCSIGAAAVFPFGPMLIVFGMCLAGSISMVIHEVVWHQRIGAARDNHQESASQTPEAMQPRLDVSKDQ